MSDIVDLDDYRLHKNGVVICLGCHHEWVGVAPTETEKFECPNCGHMEGRMVEDDGNLIA